MKNKLLIVDGLSILFRSYYGMPAMTSPEGTQVGAVYGFLNTLLKTISDFKIDMVVAAFDSKGKNFRHEIAASYKNNRKKAPNDFTEQVPVIQELLRDMGISIVAKEGFEGDDIVGTIAKSEVEKGLEVYILSGDRDLLALVSDNCYQIYPSTSTKSKGQAVKSTKLFGIEEVKAFMGVTPDRIRDLKAIMGDSSDNISGVKGVGKKGAKELIAAYGSLDEVYANIEAMKKNKRRDSLIAYKEDAYISYELAQIRTDVKGLEYSLVMYSEGIKPELETSLVKYGLNSLRNRLINVDNSILKEFELVMVELNEFKKIVDGLDMPYDVSITMASEKNVCFAFENEMTAYIMDKDIKEAINYVNDGAMRIITFDIKSFIDILPLDRDGRDYFDAKLAAYVLGSSDKLGYENIYQKYGKASVLFKEKPSSIEVAAYKARVAMDTVVALEKAILEEDVYQLFYEIEMPLAFVLSDMKREGIKIDRDALISYGKELDDKILSLEKEIYELAGEEFNIASPKQLGVILFEKLDLPFGKKNKTGWSTSVSVLDKLKTEYKIVANILMYRRYAKLNSTYVTGLLDCIKEDGRIHGSFHQTVAATGRLSSTEPNLQNLPIKTLEGREIRKAFRAKTGYTYVDADYSQIELRILAHMSKDEVMINDFKNGADIHSSTAARIFSVPIESVTKAQRRSAKAINFGIIYGMGGFSLGENLNITKKEADIYIKNYFYHYEGVKKFLDEQIEIARDCGYVSTMFNRRRYIPDINAQKFMQRSAAQRIAMNSPIQGSAADIMKIAMNNVFHRLKHDKVDAKIVLQIHDEILIEAREDQVEKVKKILVSQMQKVLKLDVDLMIDISTGHNMYELK